MQLATLEDFDKALAKWYGVAFEGKGSHGVEDCIFCNKFYKKFCGIDFKSRCVGCPVFETTRYTGCYNTPIGDFENVGVETEIGILATTEESIKAAKFEYLSIAALRYKFFPEKSLEDKDCIDLCFKICQKYNLLEDGDNCGYTSFYMLADCVKIFVNEVIFPYHIHTN